MTQGTITIRRPPPKKEFMEACLNQTASGFDMFLPIALYALGDSWHITKLIYYKNLIEEVRSSVNLMENCRSKIN